MYSKADVYRNLNKARRNPSLHIWSVRVRTVQEHTEWCVMDAASFVVGERSRQTVIRKRCRSVHAVVRGAVTLTGADAREYIESLGTTTLRRVTYNPYRSGSFHYVDNGEPVTDSPVVIFTPNGCYATR